MPRVGFISLPSESPCYVDMICQNNLPSPISRSISRSEHAVVCFLLQEISCYSERSQLSRGLHLELPNVDLRRLISTANGDVTFVALARLTLISHRSMSERNALLVWQGSLLEWRLGLAISLHILVTLQELCANLQPTRQAWGVATWLLTRYCIKARGNLPCFVDAGLL